MKKRMKRITAAAAACLLSLIFAACGSSSKSNTTEDISTGQAAAYDAGGVYSNYSAEMDPEEAAPEESGAQLDEKAASGRKLIKNVNMSVETEDYTQLVTDIQEQVAALGGYIEQFESYNENSIGGRSANLTLRIPADQLDSFVTRVDEVSNVISRQESVEDVTLQYVDLESHRKMLRQEQERLLSLMEQAETIEDIITLESRLTEVRYQLESMEAQLRSMDNQVNYSTVYLYINEVTRLTPQEEKGTWERIRTGFSENMYRVGHGLKEFGIGFIISLPVLFVFVIIILIIIIILRIRIRITRKREEENRKKYGTPYRPGPMQQNDPRFAVPGSRQEPFAPPTGGPDNRNPAREAAPAPTAPDKEGKTDVPETKKNEEKH